jgi:hypothetical protein
VLPSSSLVWDVKEADVEAVVLVRCGREEGRRRGHELGRYGSSVQACSHLVVRRGEDGVHSINLRRERGMNAGTTSVTAVDAEFAASGNSSSESEEACASCVHSRSANLQRTSSEVVHSVM